MKMRTRHLDALRSAQRAVCCAQCLRKQVTLRRDGVDGEGRAKYVCPGCDRSRTRVVNGGALLA